MNEESPVWPRELSLRHDLRPGDLGRLIALHGEVYRQWPGFGLEFEAFVAATVAEFGLENGFAGRTWLLERGTGSKELVGCSAIAHRSPRLAQLRWVLLRPELCGGGLGKRLIETALTYCRETGFERVYLETTGGLEASSALYRKLGFRETDNRTAPMWREPRALIRMELDLK